MLSKKQEWEIALTTIEKLYADEINFPLSESSYTIFGYLIFNPYRPIPEEAKKLIIASYTMIYGADKII